MTIISKMKEIHHQHEDTINDVIRKFDKKHIDSQSKKAMDFINETIKALQPLTPDEFIKSIWAEGIHK